MEIQSISLASSNASDVSDSALLANMPSMDEFENVLQAAQSPPPPQPPPPPNPGVADGEKELQSNEPIAQTEKPDLSSEDDDKNDDSKKVKKPATAKRGCRPPRAYASRGSYGRSGQGSCRGPWENAGQGRCFGYSGGRQGCFPTT